MRKNMVAYLTVALTALLLPLVAAANPKVTQFQPLGLSTVEKLEPNGEYEVYVLKDNAWREAGSLTYDKFFREQKLDLGSIMPKDGPARVRIVQKGGGAAHIDSVFLGGAATGEVKGIEDMLALKKLSKKDFDVIDAFEKGIELVFPAQGKDKTLALTARVENKVISKNPFQFPAENLYRQVNENSRFYTYMMNPSDKESFSGDIVLAKPFFKEYSRTGSGHPSGFTYGWVRSDDENLYVKIDFTPDNTMDGEKDYAKVYIKTDEGVKEFNVSVPETKWGKPEFTYTDKVPYQHKVYDFKIPLKEIGLKGPDKELLLAFSAYGTAVPGDQVPTIAFDTKNNRYLAVYQSNWYQATGSDIRGQIINADGTLSGSEIVISDAAGDQYTPHIYYDSVNSRFFVVWRHQRSGIADIYGQLVNIDGTLNGSNFLIFAESDVRTRLSAAYDSANQRFLVTWGDNRSGRQNLYGQLVYADGSLNGANFLISDAVTDANNPSVIYDIANQRFLVVWEDWRDGVAIYAQLVNGDGTLNGANFRVSTDSKRNTSVAYDSTNHRFLVVWEGSIQGQIVNGDGSLSGNSFVLSSGDDRGAKIAYDSRNQRFLVLWIRGDSEENMEIYGQLVNADGLLSGSEIVIANTALTQQNPSASYNPNCANFMVAYDLSENLFGSNNTIGFSLVGACSPPEATPPTVTSVSPANGAAGVAINTFMTATFSEAMDPTTITSNSFTINGGVSGTVSYNGDTNTATFTPSANLAYGTTYIATITTGVKDLAGNAMAANYTWSFSTASFVAPTPPAVILTSPANNTNGVARQTVVTATFSKSIEPSTITNATFSLGGVTGAVSYDAVNRMAVFTPSSRLANLTTYTATITTAVKDLDGNAIAADYLWSFMTANEESGIPAGDAPLIMGGGGCFIAIAAPGSLDQDVKKQQEFIERHLLAGLASRSVAIYRYHESTSITHQTNLDESLRAIKRGATAIPTLNMRYLILLAVSIPVSILLIVLFRRRIRNAAVILLLVNLFTVYPVYAFDGHIFIPQVGEEDFIAVQSSSTLEAGGISAGFALDYARRPVILSNGSPLSKEQLAGTVFGGLGISSAFQIGVVFPYLLSQDGLRADGTDTKSSAPGDITFSAKYRLAGGGENEFGLAASAFLTAPSGAQDDWFGSRSYTGGAMLIVDKKWAKKTTATVNLGYRISKEERLSPTQETGSALLFGIGLAHNLNQDFVITGEIHGNAPSADLFKEKVSPLEVDVSLGYRFWGNSRIFIGAGAGLTDGVGAPDWRIIMGLNLIGKSKS